MTMVFNPGSRNLNSRKFYLNDNELGPVKDFNYSGEDISMNGSFFKAIENLEYKRTKQCSF